MIGIKYDSEKEKWSLLPLEPMKEVVQVLMHGAKKYAPDNWKYVKPKERYFDACLRHLSAWQAGEKNDSETGLSHIAHAVCCLVFLLWHDMHDKKKIDNNLNCPECGIRLQHIEGCSICPNCGFTKCMV